MGVMRHMVALTSLISEYENRPEHRPSAMSIRLNEYVRYTGVQSINQSINQSIDCQYRDKEIWHFLVDYFLA
jgi:hypothetical protein